MPSRPGPARRVYQPGTDFHLRTIPVTHQPQRAWFRLHRSGMTAIQFGVRAHHRFSHPDCPFPLLYVGASIPACLWECFGDDVFGGQRVMAATRWNRCSLSRITVPQLRVCAVSLEPTRDAMEVDKASLLANDLRVPQSWGLAVQQHPAAFEAIKYSSRFLDQPCLAVFDRGGMAAQLREDLLGPLERLEAAADWLEEHQVALV